MEKLEKRFWDKVKKTEGCWLWSARKTKDGYGQIKIEGVAKLAHRISYLLNRGEISDGLLVCHSCDNPSCVRPDHLFLGTALDNTQDRIMKGRPGNVVSGVGREHKLTDVQIVEIREHLKRGSSQRCIAKQYGVSQPLISYIKNLKKWDHV